MKLENVKYSLYKYKINSLQLTYGSKSKKHQVTSESIAGFQIIEDYEKYILPYFEMTISVPNEIYRELVKNKKTIKANFILYKHKINQVFDIDMKNTSFKKAYEGTYKVIISENGPDLTEEEQKLIEKSGEQYGQLSVVKMLLYPYNFYTNYNQIINNVLLNVSLTDVLAYLLNKVKIKKVLLSPPAKQKKFDQFILTPIPFNKQLLRICNTYALHKKGTLIFCGLDRFYIIDKIPSCTAFSLNENKITYVIASTDNNGLNQVGGSYENKKDKYGVINSINVKFDENDEIVDKSYGSNIVSIDADGKIVKTNKKAKKINRVIVKNEGKNQVDNIKQAYKESKHIMTIGMRDEDINMLSPNKQFIITISGAKYKKYNGKYRIVKVAHSFEKEGDYFTLHTIANFRS